MQEHELARRSLRSLLQHEGEVFDALNGQLLLQGQDHILQHRPLGEGEGTLLMRCADCEGTAAVLVNNYHN